MLLIARGASSATTVDGGSLVLVTSIVMSARLISSPPTTRNIELIDQFVCSQAPWAVSDRVGVLPRLKVFLRGRWKKLVKPAKTEVYRIVQKQQNWLHLHLLKRLPYSERLKAFQIPTLHYRRIRGDMIETYKIITGKYQGCVGPSLVMMMWTLMFFSNCQVHIWEGTN